MIKILTVITFFLSFNIIIAFEKQKGIIYTKKGEQLNVEIKVYEYDVILSNNKIVFYENDKKKKININQVEKILLDDKIYEVISFQKKTTTGPNRGAKTFKLLTELIVDGRVKLYRKYQLVSNGYMSNGLYITTGTYLTERNYFVEESSYARLVTKLDFKKKVKLFFSECNFLEGIEKIKYRNIREIVVNGNKKCN